MKENVKIGVAEVAVVLTFLVPFAVTPYQLPHHTFVPAIIGAFALPGLAAVFLRRASAASEVCSEPVPLPPTLAWSALPLTILIHAGALDGLGVGIKAVVLVACVAGLGVLAAFAAAPLVATLRPSWGVTARPSWRQVVAIDLVVVLLLFVGRTAWRTTEDLARSDRPPGRPGEAHLTSAIESAVRSTYEDLWADWELADPSLSHPTQYFTLAGDMRLFSPGDERRSYERDRRAAIWLYLCGAGVLAGVVVWRRRKGRIDDARSGSGGKP